MPLRPLLSAGLLGALVIGLGAPVSSADRLNSPASAAQARWSPAPAEWSMLPPGPALISAESDRDGRFAPEWEHVDALVAGALAEPKAQAEPEESLDACVAQEMAQRQAAGVSLAVAVDGEITYVKGYGAKHLEEGGEIGPATMFRFGSTLKQMTAAALLQQVEAGTLALDDPVTGVVPEFAVAPPADASNMTWFHALTHSTGFPDRLLTLVSDTSLEEWATQQGDVSPYSPPGSFWNYSNPGFTLAGLAVERTSGTPYREYMRDHVWAPAGMPLTTMDPADVISHGDYAWGHVGSERLAPDAFDNIWAGPAGFGFSTPTELVRWALLLSEGGGEVLSPQSAAELQAPLVSTNYVPHEHYGLGVFVHDYAALGDPGSSVTVYEHGGNIPGFSSQLYWVPDAGFAVSVLANTTASMIGTAHCALGLYAGAERRPWQGMKDVDAWEEFTGTYSMLNVLGTTWTAQVHPGDDTALRLEYSDIYPGASMTVTHGVSNTFIAGQIDFTFLREADGAVRWMRNRQQVGERFGRVPSSVTVAGGECVDLAVLPEMNIDELGVRVFGPAEPISFYNVDIEHEPGDPTTAAFKFSHDLEHPAGLVTAQLVGPADADLDLYVLYDRDGDGEVVFPDDVDDTVWYTLSEGSSEFVLLNGVQPAGHYEFWVHGASVGEPTTFDLYVTAISGDGLTGEGFPASAQAGREFEGRVCGTVADGEPGVGLVELTYGWPPRRINVLVDWQPELPEWGDRLFLPVAKNAD